MNTDRKLLYSGTFILEQSEKQKPALSDAHYRRKANCETQGTVACGDGTPVISRHLRGQSQRVVAQVRQETVLGNNRVSLSLETKETAAPNKASHKLQRYLSL